MSNIPVTIFSPAERSTLQAVCETLFPTLQPEQDDNPGLFELHAEGLELAAAMEQAISGLDVDQQSQFKQLLRTLEQPLLMAVLAGSFKRFSALDQAKKERALLALGVSPVPLLRTGFQCLKRLASFLFMSVPDDKGTNPSWPLVGYTPSTKPPAAPAMLAVTSLGAITSTKYECDVCIIGSGAGGGVVAGELAATGKQVLVLEAGGGPQAPDFEQLELEGMQKLYLDQGMASTRDLGVAILAGATLGGGTTVNWQTSLPTPPRVRDEWSELSGCKHFVEESFTASLEAVMTRINAHASPESINRNNAKLRDGCAALGYSHSTLARNDKNCDLPQCGYCVYGCRHNGKQSTAVTYLADAQRQGNTTILVNCRADRIRILNGRATGVEATVTDPATGAKTALTINASTVVVAAGAIHSPALLLRSGLELPMLGRNLYLHPTSAVAGTYEDVIAPWQGPGQSVLCDEFAWRDGTYGYRLENAPAHPGMLALASPWFGARRYRREMQDLKHRGVIIVLTRDRTGGRVRVNRRGHPIIDYRPGAQERAFLKHGIGEAARVHLAAGATDVLSLHTKERPKGLLADRSPASIDALCLELGKMAVDRNWSVLFSAHQMGTCRMGRDARTGVCDARGEVFGVRGLFIADTSAFPAASGVNPMISVMGLAHHTAQGIKAQL